MAKLTPQERARLRKAHRAGDADTLDETVEDIVEKKLKRWRRGKHGAYGLIDDCESREGQQRAAQIVAEAWRRLRRLGDADTVSAMDEYEQEQGGPPTYDAAGNVVDSDVGGSTETVWKEIPGGYRQVESGRIYIGSKWICRRKRSGSKHVVLAVMKTLLHELMGHWDKQGQRLRGSTVDQRRTKSERIADRVTEDLWSDIRHGERWDDAVSDLKAEVDAREPAQEQAIRDAVTDYLGGL